MSWSRYRLIRLHRSEWIYTDCSSTHIGCPNYFHIFLLIFTSEYQYPTPYLYVGISASILHWNVRLSLRRNVRLFFTSECPTLFYVGMSDSFLLRANVQLLIFTSEYLIIHSCLSSLVMIHLGAQFHTT